jgi:RNA polymerase sigma-70 factor (ECF subfamily)
MVLPTAPSVRGIDAAQVQRLYTKAEAWRWGLAKAEFEAALERSVAHRFRGPAAAPAHEVLAYLDGLHLPDLALACACARGSDAAWEHFVRAFRPALLAAASAASSDGARELADSIYAELFGIEERDGVRRSLFDYFHGRSSLAGWLRAVLAQRAVDRARRSRRFAPLPEPDTPGEPSVPAAQGEADTGGRLAMVRAALAAALRALPAGDRLRLALYYTRDLKLAAIGRLVGESEATVSRKLARCRERLRRAVELRLRERHGLDDAQIGEAFDLARTDPAFDLARSLPPPEEVPNAE